MRCLRAARLLREKGEEWHSNDFMVVQPTKGFSATMITGERAVGSALERPTGCLDDKRKRELLTRSISSVSVLSFDDETSLECLKGLSESRRYLSAFRRSFRSNDSHPDISLGRSAFFADCSSNLVSLRIAV